MTNKTSHSRSLLAILVAALSMPVPPVRAEIVTPDRVATQGQADADRAKVQSFLDQANVRDKLQAMGVGGLAAKDRVAAMSEEEVHALAQRIDTMPAGGALGTTDMILILLLVILVAVLI